MTNYYEMVMPYNGDLKNRQFLHGQMKKRLLPKDVSERNFIYQVLVRGDQHLVHVRSEAPHIIEGNRWISREFDFSEGDTIELNLVMAATKRVRDPNRNYKPVVKRLSEDELAPFALNELLRAGLDVDQSSIDATFTQNESFQINKRDHGNWYVATADIRAKAVVSDLNAFKNAFIHGIGRKKTYGLGLINAKKMNS